MNKEKKLKTIYWILEIITVLILISMIFLGQGVSHDTSLMLILNKIFYVLLILSVALGIYTSRKFKKR